MNILITNLNNTYNYGSMMMGENLITYLKNKISDCNFYIDALTEEHTDRLKQACMYENIYLDSIFKIHLITNKIKGVRRFERKIKDALAYNKCKKFYDVIFILGGDDFSEIYYKIPEETNLVFKALKHIENLNKSSKLYMIGQTIGPYTDERLTYAKEVFNEIKIYSRDETSKEYLEKNNINVEVSRDLAFLNLNLQSKKLENKVLMEYNLEKEGYIVIVGTGLFENYTKNQKNMLKSFETIIKKIKDKYPDKKIVWLSHVLNCNATDNRMLEKINKNLFDIIIERPILPVEARMILGNGYLTITCRMHAAVSTFQMGRPAICISYSQKYNGVIARGLKMKKLVIEAKDDKIWNNKIVKEVINRTEYIDDNYDEIKNNIKKEVSKCQKQVNNMLEKIVKEIEN